MVTRGFTGHEQLDEVNLIHMNGRIFDPVIGRFLSADPTIPALNNPQALNRYSYVLNNPLSYTDPTGYSFESVLKKMGNFFNKYGGTIMAIALTAVPGVNIWATMALGFMSGMMASGGDLRAGLIGGITAGALYGVGFLPKGAFTITAHGVIGGVRQKLTGGTFKAGFIAGAFTQSATNFLGEVAGAATRSLGIPNRLANAVAGAVAGGTASVIGGDKFANGAVTGAFSRMFGDFAAESQRKATREAAVPDDVKYAVEKTFETRFGERVSIDQIKVVENSKWADFLSGLKQLQTGGRYYIAATTQENTIYLSSRLTAQQFFANSELVLHEFYHVINQWNNSRMNNFTYVANPNGWEQEAEGFASQNTGRYEFFLGRP